MAEMSVLEQQQRIVGPDGKTYYLGDGQVANPFTAINNEASATMVVGEVARIDSTNTVIPRTVVVAVGAAVPATIPQSISVKLLRISAANNINYLGVARSSIPATKSGGFAGPGSLVSAVCLTSPGDVTLGDFVIGSTTAGAVNFATTAATGGTRAGLLVQTPLVHGGAVDSGVAAILVQPQ